MQMSVGVATMAKTYLRNKLLSAALQFLINLSLQKAIVAEVIVVRLCAIPTGAKATDTTRRVLACLRLAGMYPLSPPFWCGIMYWVGH